jgi:hypothetical protein
VHLDNQYDHEGLCSKNDHALTTHPTTPPFIIWSKKILG